MPLISIRGVGLNSFDGTVAIAVYLNFLSVFYHKSIHTVTLRRQLGSAKCGPTVSSIGMSTPNLATARAERHCKLCRHSESLDWTLSTAVMSSSNIEDHVAFGPGTPVGVDTFRGAPDQVLRKDDLPISKKRSSQGAHLSRGMSTRSSAARNDNLRSAGAYGRKSPRTERDGQPRQVSGHDAPLPYETQIPTPHPDEPYFGKAPSTSTGTTSSCGSSKSNKSPTTDPVHALPGTMAARNARVKTSAPQDAFRCHVPQMQTESHRWRSAFKGVFSRTTTEKPQFERIKGKHWADELVHPRMILVVNTSTLTSCS